MAVEDLVVFHMQRMFAVKVVLSVLKACASAGPSGTSVREISKQTGADIKSWTEKPDHKSLSSRPTRSFVIEVLPCPPGVLPARLQCPCCCNASPHISACLTGLTAPCCLKLLAWQEVISG